MKWVYAYEAKRGDLIETDGEINLSNKALTNETKTQWVVLDAFVTAEVITLVVTDKFEQDSFVNGRANAQRLYFGPLDGVKLVKRWNESLKTYVEAT